MRQIWTIVLHKGRPIDCVDKEHGVPYHQADVEYRYVREVVKEAECRPDSTESTLGSVFPLQLAVKVGLSLTLVVFHDDGMLVPLIRCFRKFWWMGLKTYF